MQTIRNRYIKQAAFSRIISLVLMMMIAHFAGIPTVFAKDKDQFSEIQLDSLINTATKDMEAERWDDAVQNFEKALNLGVNLPGEIHFHYGKALLKTVKYSIRYQVLLIILH